MKSNIQYYGALQKYTLSIDYPSNEIYLHIEDVEAIPIEWLEKWQGKQYCLQDEGKAKITVIEMLEDWRKENGNV